MGYELVEQLGWEYPAAVFYPTGGGRRPDRHVEKRLESWKNSAG